MVFILAADKKRTAPLDSLISHISAYEGHAYELRWDQPIATLRDLLVLIPRMNRSVDIALDLCTQMKDTLLGNPPVVPDYLAAKETLSKLVRFLDGKPATRMVGKVKFMQTVQQQTEHLTTSESAQKVLSNSHNELLVNLPDKLQSTVSNTSHHHIKQRINSTELLDTVPAKLMSTVDNSTHDSVMQPKDVQKINELPDILTAKLHSTVDKATGYHIKQQLNN